MDIRKIIRENLEKLFEAHQDRGPFTGLEILNQYPFSKLPDVRANVNWSKRGVEGWGEVKLPSVDTGDAQSGVFGQDDVIQYIQKFEEKFGESPIFMIHPNEVWYNKIKVINPKFVNWREDYSQGKSAWLKDFGNTD